MRAARARVRRAKGARGAARPFYLSTRYPNSLPGGIPADAFAGSDAGRALDMAREVIAVVKRRLR